MDLALATPKGNDRHSGYELAAHEWYKEPRRTVDDILDVEEFIGPVLDPACGAGNIPEACRARGMVALGSDIVDRGYGATMDFLSDDFPEDSRIDNIITNPPFSLMRKWVYRSLKIATRKVAIFGRLPLLESQSRREMFLSTPIARVWVCSSRVSCPPGGVDAPSGGGSVAYAWFVFEHGYVGHPTLHWLP